MTWYSLLAFFALIALVFALVIMGATGHLH
jgi:hypothetical protein